MLTVGRIPLLLVVLATGRTAAAQPTPSLDSDAQRHLDAGLEAYEAGEFGLAIREFEAAYAIDPNPVLLYAWAQAERYDGNCRRAIDLYERFIGAKPSAVQVKAAEVGIRLCKTTSTADEGGREGTARDKEVPTAGAHRAAARSDDSHAGNRGPIVERDRSPTSNPEGKGAPWYTDPVGGALVAAGVAGLGVGTGFLIAANRSEDRAHEAEFLDDFEHYLDQASTRRRIGGGSMAVGSALLIGGILRYVLREEAGKSGGSSLVGSDGQAIYVLGAF